MGEYQYKYIFLDFSQDKNMFSIFFETWPFNGGVWLAVYPEGYPSRYVFT